MRNPDPFLTARQLARRWKINIATLRQWRWFNKGPQFQKVAGRRSQTLYRLEVIERFENALLRAHTTDQGQDAFKSIPELVTDQAQEIKDRSSTTKHTKK